MLSCLLLPWNMHDGAYKCHCVCMHTHVWNSDSMAALEHIIMVSIVRPMLSTSFQSMQSQYSSDRHSPMVILYLNPNNHHDRSVISSTTYATVVIEPQGSEDQKLGIYLPTNSPSRSVSVFRFVP